MGEDDLVELLWKSGQVVRSSQTQRPSSDKPSPPPPPPILRGSGSGGGEENAPLPLPLLQPQPQPQSQLSAPMHHQNLFIQEDEMASWLHHSYRQDYFSSELLYPGITSTHPQSSVSLAPSPSAPYILPAERPTGQILAVRRAENLMNFSWLRGNMYTDRRVEVGQSIPVVRESIQVGSSATPSSSATESCVIPAMEGTESQVSRTFSVHGLGRKGKAVAIETARTPSSGVCKPETEPIQIQPAPETETAEDRKRKEREDIQGTEEARGSTSRKRSRAAEMHNISERRRREKINQNMKTLQELIPGCNKSDKVSVLDDVIAYVKSLESQIQMMSMGHGMTPPMMYAGNMQQFMPNTAMGGMGMNQPPFIPFPGTPFPRPPDISSLGPPYPAPRYPFPNVQTSDPSRVHVPTPLYPFPNIQTSDPSIVHLPTPHYPFPNIHTSDPSRVHLPTPQPNPVANRPQFPAYMDPYRQFVGLQQMQQPPPHLQSQTTSQLSFSQASSSKELKDPDNKPTGY